MQRIEHYEIAAYGTNLALATALGEEAVADLLAATLEEEKQTDRRLTEVTQQEIMPSALSDDKENEQPAERKKPAGRPRAG
jgi:ferritin-like metal-binding protein YciE